MKEHIRVATRGSLLALAQTKQVASRLEELNPGLSCEIVTIKTTGDRVTDRPLSSFRGTGVFVKELQNALLSGEADLAVHSLKDVPVESHPELSFCAFPVREMPNDVFITNNNETVYTLKKDACIGTSSLRRLVQIKALRPDFRFADLRGNLDTRLRKLQEGQYDAIILAAAGLRRLGKSFTADSVLTLTECLPAAGQGALALECRAEDSRIHSLVSKCNDLFTQYAVESERLFLKEIGGGCTLPIGVYANVKNESITVSAVIGDNQSNELVRQSLSGPSAQRFSLSSQLASTVLEICKREEIALQ